jgi:hypothetical protein
MTAAAADAGITGRPEAVQSIQTGLGHATSVDALLLPSRDLDQDVKRSPLIHGDRWKQSEKSNSRAVIDKRCGRFHLRFHFSLSAIMSNEVVGSYSLL